MFVKLTPDEIHFFWSKRIEDISEKKFFFTKETFLASIVVQK